MSQFRHAVLLSREDAERLADDLEMVTHGVVGIRADVRGKLLGYVAFLRGSEEEWPYRRYDHDSEDA